MDKQKEGKKQPEDNISLHPLDTESALGAVFQIKSKTKSKKKSITPKNNNK